MTAPTTPLEQPEFKKIDVPDELKPVDLFFRQAMNARKAPDYVREAWDGFLVAVARWTAEEKTEKK